MEPFAEVLNVGNELLSGIVVNTNASWICRKLTLLGFEVKRITVVGDHINDIASALRESLARNPRLIVVTGGLGPTFDDVTREAVAEALGRRLVLNGEALEMVKEKCLELGLEFTESRSRMAMIPERAIPLFNPAGIAPGFYIKLGETTIFVLPGVPREVKSIFEKVIEPIIMASAPMRGYAEAFVYVEGVTESTGAPIIESIMKRDPRVYIKSHPRGWEEVSKIIYHVISYGEDRNMAEESVENAVRELMKRLAEKGAKIVRRTSCKEFSDETIRFS